MFGNFFSVFLLTVCLTLREKKLRFFDDYPILIFAATAIGIEKTKHFRVIVLSFHRAQVVVV